MGGKFTRYPKLFPFFCNLELRTWFLQDVKKDLGSAFTIITAFSRETSKKIYVQHRLEENATLVNKLLQEEKANFYVCGDAANMARDVNTKLAKIISEQRGIDLEKGEDIVKAMRSNNQYQEDVWS